MSKHIVCVGSCMIDFTSYASRLPKVGETLHGYKFATSFGGKGANQCVAAAKLGGHVLFIARVGDDMWGPAYKDHLQSEKVDISNVLITKNETSGVAQICVAENADNHIIIVAGANNHLSKKDIIDRKDVLNSANLLMMQLEVPVETVIECLKSFNGISILNAAPATNNPNKLLYTLPTIFCVNESEASVCTELPVNNIEEGKKAVHALLKFGCKSVILTLGSEGALYASKEEPKPIHVPTPKVKAVDTTGAGDAFIGALAYCLVYKPEFNMNKAITVANYLAAQSVTKPGTQKSFGDATLLSAILEKIQ